MKNNRYNQSLAPIVHYQIEDAFIYPVKILLSPNDQGVIRNQGKNGSRFAPKAIVNLLKKQNNHLGHQANEAILLKDVWKSEFGDQSFENLQKQSSMLIAKEIEHSSLKSFAHIGGGHDHIFPLLMAIDKCKKYKNVLIINIDAHCDTRTDSISHSGTPFRDYDKNGTKPFHLIQYGIHDFANSASTLTPLNRGSEKKIFHEELQRLSHNQTMIPKEMLASCPFTISNETAVILSLDCDGLSGAQMSAVSSVNTLGVSLEHTLELIKELKRISQNKLIFGVYEFNPVFDNLSLLGCKSIVHLIYEFLKVK